MPLHYAADNGHLEVARLLLERSAKMEAKENVRTPLQCPSAADAVLFTTAQR